MNNGNGNNNNLGREQLLRLAALDVLGLLDPYESEQFDRSFHEATAAVQDEVISVQAAIASDPSFLHEEAPSSDLRERVLAKVAEAIEKETEMLAPIPIFQRRRVQAEAHRREVRRLERSTVVWRAASFVLAACFVITLIIMVQESKRSTSITQLALDRTAQDQLTEMIGDTWREFVGHPYVDVIALRPEVADFPGGAMVHLNPRSGSVFIVGLGLPRDVEYRVVARNAEGQIIVQSDVFASNGSVAAIRIDNLSDFDALRGAHWEVIDISADRRVLA